MKTALTETVPLTADSVEARLTALEAKMPSPEEATTTLARLPIYFGKWALTLGAKHQSKVVFRGSSIEDVLTQAEKAVAAMTGELPRVPSDEDALLTIAVVGKKALG